MTRKSEHLYCRRFARKSPKVLAGLTLDTLIITFNFLNPPRRSHLSQKRRKCTDMLPARIISGVRWKGLKHYLPWRERNDAWSPRRDRKSTRLNSSHSSTSY